MSDSQPGDLPAPVAGPGPEPDRTRISDDPFLQDCLQDLRNRVVASQRAADFTRNTDRSIEEPDSSISAQGIFAQGISEDAVAEAEFSEAEFSEAAVAEHALAHHALAEGNSSEPIDSSHSGPAQEPARRKVRPLVGASSAVAASVSSIEPQRHSTSQPLHLITSTLLSLLMVMALLLTARLMVPSLVESIRYGWYRGQLRAEYELSGQRLQNVSLDSLADVSQLVSQRVGPSVVHINLLRKNLDQLDQFERLFGRTHPMARYEGQGSGFVIDPSGYILTNHHVLEGVGDIEVTLSDGRQLAARIIGVDPLTDLAVIKVEAKDLMPVDWGDSDDVVVGTPVWAAGSPFGLQKTVTFGIISGKHRIDLRGTKYEHRDESRGTPEEQGIRGGNPYGDLMQSDVALNPGNSGGPLVNSLGEVVGVNAAILGETYHGVSFSIPSKVAQRVADHLMAGSVVPRGWLGVKLADLPMERRYGSDGKAVPGVRVEGFPIDSPSPARDAGMKAGDLIVEFAGQPVLSQVDLMRMISETEVGSRPKVVVVRNGARQAVEVVIGQRSAGL